MSPSKSKKEYYSSLDGLRLLASISIVLFHYEIIGGFHDMQGSPGWLFAILKGPVFHTSLFFILAGFLYGVKFLPNPKTFKLFPFLKKRFIQLYPLHCITALLMATLYIMRSPEIDLGKLAYSLLIHLLLLFSVMPFDSFNLNLPSWALSAFLVAYLCLGPSLLFIYKVKKTRYLLGLGTLFFLPGLVLSMWTNVLPYTPELYQFFHSLGIYRVFEFLLGLVAAQYFLCQKKKPFIAQWSPWKIDMSILAIMAYLVFLLFVKIKSGPIFTWILFHTLMPLAYLALVLLLTTHKGMVNRFLSTKTISQMGKNSFTPYLIHIPLVTWIGFSFEQVGFREFLHSPLNIVLLLVILYGATPLWNYLKSMPASSFYLPWRGLRALWPSKQSQTTL